MFQNNLTRRSLSLLVVALGLVSMVACSGGGGGNAFTPPAATVDVNGDWEMNMRVDATECGGEVEESNDPVQMIQNGNAVELILADGSKRQGSISGNVITAKHEQIEKDEDSGLNVTIREDYRFEVAADGASLTGSGTQQLVIEGLFECTANVIFNGTRL